MRFCDSEENRRKLAWLVPGYILLAWFFCVVFQVSGCLLLSILLTSPPHNQPNLTRCLLPPTSLPPPSLFSPSSLLPPQPLGLTSVPGHGNNNDYNDESLYEIINLQDDPQVNKDQ